MKIALSYSHVDIAAALRLLVWLKFLGYDQLPLWVLATRKSLSCTQTQKIRRLVAEFGGTFHVERSSDGRGWPVSATHAFIETLSQIGDDFFWLEPDCVPLREGWWEDLQKEFDGTVPFVGAFVPANTCTVEHMTGCGFYRKDAATVAPSLMKFGKVGAWDVDAADEVLPNFKNTPLVHHYWHRIHSVVVTPDMVRPDAVVFHQCKTGFLMISLRPEFLEFPLTRELIGTIRFNTMPKFYLLQGQHKDLKIGGKNFQFEPSEFFAGTWWSTLRVDDSTDASMLDLAVLEKRITEISPDEYERFEIKKKRANPSASHLIKLHPSLSPQTVGAPKPAVVAEAKVQPESFDEIKRTAPARKKG